MNLKEYLSSGSKARNSVNVTEVEEVSRILYKTIIGGGKLVTFGNGGSAADAQHFVAELTGHFLVERKPLPAIALTTNTSALTAIGNDYTYEDIFDRQVKALVTAKDMVFGISTSGNSLNVIRAIKSANEIGAYTVAMTGVSGGKLKGIAKKMITVESDFTPVIQEVHIAIIHMICMELDRLLLA